MNNILIPETYECEPCNRKRMSKRVRGRGRAGERTVATTATAAAGTSATAATSVDESSAATYVRRK